jgi:hypothetical protein
VRLAVPVGGTRLTAGTGSGRLMSTHVLAVELFEHLGVDSSSRSGRVRHGEAAQKARPSLRSSPARTYPRPIGVPATRIAGAVRPFAIDIDQRRFNRKAILAPHQDDCAFSRSVAYSVEQCQPKQPRATTATGSLESGISQDTDIPNNGIAPCNFQAACLRQRPRSTVEHMEGFLLSLALCLHKRMQKDVLLQGSIGKTKRLDPLDVHIDSVATQERDLDDELHGI